MSVYFLDTSGLIKRFTRETGSSWILALFKPSNNNILFISRITPVEAIAGLAKQNRMGNLSSADLSKSVKRFKRSLESRYAFVEISETVAGRAMDLAEKYGLRGYDAVQLSSATQIEKKRKSLSLSSLVFVSADNILNNAAAAEGLQIENPNHYP
jgi:uncharacterized protein